MNDFQDERSAEERVLVGLSRIGTVLRNHAWQGASPRGIHPTQMQVLMFLARSHPRGLRLSEVADRLAVTLPTASESVSALERKGLVVRTEDPSDRRAQSIGLTPVGREEAARGAQWPELILSAVDELDPNEKGTLLRVIMKMIRGFQARGEISPHRMCVTCRYFQPHRHIDPERPHHCGFVDAAFGDGQLRFDCREFEAADPETKEATWEAFVDRGVPADQND